MLEEKRKHFVIKRIGSAIFDRVEEDILNGVMSEEEGMWVYKLAGLQWRFDYPFVYTTDTHIEENPMQERLCLFREKGKTLPKEVLALACENYTSAAGLAAIVGGKLVTQTTVGEAKADPIKFADELFTQVDEYKDTHFLLCFAHSDSTVLPDDVQPYTVPGVPAAVFLIGDFSSCEKPKNSYSGAWHFFHERMKPKLIKLWKGNEEDLEAFAKDASEGDECQVLQKMMPEGTCMVMLLENGDMIPIDPFGMEKEHDPWGCAYGEPAEEVDTNGHEEPAPKPELTPQPEKVPSFFGKKPAEAPKPEPQKIAATGTQAALEAISKQFPGVDFAYMRNPQDGKVTAQLLMERFPGPDSANKNQVKKWYENRLGYCPANWKSWPLIPAQRQDTVKLADLPSSTAMSTVMQGKDLATKHIGVVEPGLKFTEDQKKNAKSLVVKIFGNNTEILSDPRKMFDAEKDSPSVAAELGLEGLDQFRLPLLARYHICKEDPVLGARVLGDAMRERYDLQTERNALKAELASLKTENEKLMKDLEAATKPAVPPPATATQAKPEAGKAEAPKFFSAAKRR